MPGYYAKEHSYLNVGKPLYAERIVNELIQATKITKEQKILEIGCGRGRFSLPLLEKGFDVTCLDESKELLGQLRQKRIAGKEIKILEGDFNELCAGHKAEFDAVIGFYILHHFSDLRKAVQNIKLVLKGNGNAVGFIEPNPFNFMYYIQILAYKDMVWENEKGMLNMTKKNLFRAFDGAGFKEFELKRFGFTPPFVMNTRTGFKIDAFLGKIGLFEKIRPYQLVLAKA